MFFYELYQPNIDLNKGVESWLIHCTETDEYPCRSPMLGYIQTWNKRLYRTGLSRFHGSKLIHIELVVIMGIRKYEIKISRVLPIYKPNTFYQTRTLRNSSECVVRTVGYTEIWANGCAKFLSIIYIYNVIWSCHYVWIVGDNSTTYFWMSFVSTLSRKMVQWIKSSMHSKTPHNQSRLPCRPKYHDPQQ